MCAGSCALVVVEHESRRSSLNHVQFSNVGFSVRCPSCTGIFQRWFDERFVGGLLRCLWGRCNIPSEKGHLCLLGNVVSAFAPGKVVADGHTKVFGISLRGKLLTVVVSTDGSSLVCDAKNFTLVGIEGHLPLAFPDLETVKILLELDTVWVMLDLPI